MFYELITSKPFNCILFSKLSDAKRYVVVFHGDAPSVIRHKTNDRTIRITTYYPRSGFKTESVEVILSLYEKSKIVNQDFDSF